MPRAAMFTVFAYDISEDRKRRKVAAILEDHAVRVQNSVFEAWMTEPQAERLAERIETHLAVGDSLRVYAVGRSGLDRCRTFGGPAIVESSAYLIA